ncbi:MAG: alpha/beta hydrolase [Burkholderiales bacterium]|nr:alpha/beta hydrolase [Burkholderiales bacterium]
MLFPSFATGSATVNGVEIAYVTGGRADGPPLLLLHGHPQTRAIWHRVAPALAKEFHIVAADLRGYGDSAKPAGKPDHYNYSKREMARDMVDLMRALGHERFLICAHDRGARVAHRLCLDHPAAVQKAVLLDIAPTLAMYEGTNMAFAQAYSHWFFLIQPHPLPERMIEADPEFFVRGVMGRGPKGLDIFAPEALAEYIRCARLPGTVHAICEDYRAAATIDLEHDRADRVAGRKLHVPLRVYWGAEGVIERCFNALALWRDYATEVEGEALPCGHYIPEEAPEALVARLFAFFR